ncbi:MAG: hypothetical protein AAB590_02130 [Patescibacteria group bacterium]|mgnify:CR=1 FL=1
MKTVLTIIIIIILTGAGVFWYLREPAGSPSSFFPLPYSTPVTALTQTYTDSARRFSFNYPEGYKVREMQGDGPSRTLLLESTSTSLSTSTSPTAGVQIVITPDETNTNITAEIIRQAIPDMKIENPEPFAVGSSSGLAFRSDNPAFSGASREIWFTSGGYLYQISTYATNDELLKKMFDTWAFF